MLGDTWQSISAYVHTDRASQISPHAAGDLMLLSMPTTRGILPSRPTSGPRYLLLKHPVDALDGCNKKHDNSPSRTGDLNKCPLRCARQGLRPPRSMVHPPASIFHGLYRRKKSLREKNCTRLILPLSFLSHVLQGDNWWRNNYLGVSATTPVFKKWYAIP